MLAASLIAVGALTSGLALVLIAAAGGGTTRPSLRERVNEIRGLPKPQDPLRGLPQPQRHQIHRALMLGRPVPAHLAGAAAEKAHQLRASTWVGGIWTVLGVVKLADNTLDPRATGWSWLTAALALADGTAFLFFGFNARRTARAAAGAEQHPR